jgi:hypothetical protein
MDVLKLFIVAVKTSYERGNLSIAELVESVHQCPVNTAGRPLMEEEIQLRTTWIHAVHLMLNYIDHETNRTIHGGDAWDLDLDVKSTYEPILSPIVLLHETDGKLKTNDFVQEHADVLPGTVLENEQQRAIVSQTIKVLWFTLVVLDEERLANDDIATPPPAPPIPRGKKKGFGQ